MLTIKKPDQILWVDLPYIEVPFLAKQSIQENANGYANMEYINNVGKFSLPEHSGSRLNRFSEIERQLEDGQAFLINPNTRFSLLNPVTLDKNNSIKWSFKAPVNDMLKNAVEGMLFRVERPGAYTYVDNEQSSAATSEQQTKKVITKHQLNIKYDLVEGANNPEKYEVKLCVFNENKQYMCMRQLMDVMAEKNGGQTSKVFKLEQGETFKVYPVREHMMDVREDLSKNKNFALSESNQRIKALEIETSESISGDVTLHTVTVKVPPILRMGCFFDGTNNDESNAVKFSNVQKLSKFYNIDDKNPYEAVKYIRGVGSDGDGWIGEKWGGATGAGALDRIAGMLHELEEACKNYIDKYEQYPESIQLDVFGFSRGATTARHFMNVLKQGFYGFKDQKFQTYITPKNIMFSFVGLFDSVGSYGIAGDNEDYGYNFHIRPQWLTEKAKVIHLIALNEYRKNFDLQTILINQNRKYPEDRVKGQFYEIGLIGSHSDVGGSYGPNEQGVVNNDQNPSQLSLMALEKMYEYAKNCDVPLTPLSISRREVGLVDNYTTLEEVFKDSFIKTTWMQWVEYEKFIKILNERIGALEKLAPRNKKMALAVINKKKAAASLQIDKHKKLIENKMGKAEFQRFKTAYEHLEEYYIHESHGPFNSGIGMSAEIEEDELNIKHLTRTVFFKPAVDFEQVNKELDRITYRRGQPVKVDIDEFDFVMAKPFQ